MEHFDLRLVALLVGLGCWEHESHAEDRALPVAEPVGIVAEPVIDPARGLGKLFGKTTKTMAHGGDNAGVFKKRIVSKDLGAPEKRVSSKLFDPKRGESPIRTARLFRIQLSSQRETVPVAW